MSRPSPPTVAQLTPPGRGAVATLLVEGPGALAAVQAQFRAAGARPLADFPADRLVFGHLGGEPGEEVVIRVRSDQSVEIHCHAGQAAPAMVRDLLVAQGCRPATWQERTAAAEPDPLRAAALVALADARTERTAAILLDQYQGALGEAIRGIRESIERRDTAAAKEKIEALLARADIGVHLTQPWRVVVAGPPNVGKSTLINALVGYPRAIVDPRAGTTRDVVSATTAVDGWPVEFSDTAGLRPTDEPLEKAGVELAKQKLSGADRVILVFDASRPWTRDEVALAAEWPGAMIVHNKVDLVGSAEVPGQCRPPGVAVSALLGEGVETLLAAIAGRIVPHPPPQGAPVLFAPGQIEWLGEVLSALVIGDWRAAIALLGTIGGNDSPVSQRERGGM